MILLALACSNSDEPESPAVGGPLAAPQEVEVGARAVDFVLEGHDGEPVRLADYEGQVVVLDLSGFD